MRRFSKILPIILSVSLLTCPLPSHALDALAPPSRIPHFGVVQVVSFDLVDGELFDRRGIRESLKGQNSEAKAALAKALGMDPGKLDACRLALARSVEEDVKALRGRFPKWGLFDGTCKVKIVAGRPKQSAYWAEDGSLVLAFDLMQRKIPEGEEPEDLKAARQEAYEALRFCVLLRQGLLKSEKLVGEAFAEQPDRAKKSALVQLLAHCMQFHILAPMTAHNPQIEAYCSDPSSPFHYPLKELRTLRSPDRVVREIQNRFLGKENLKIFETDADLEQSMIARWPAIATQMDIKDAAVVMARSISHYIRNAFFSVLGFQGLLGYADSEKSFLEYYQKLIHGIGRVLKEYDGLKNIKNPYLVALKINPVYRIELEEIFTVPEGANPRETALRLKIIQSLLGPYESDIERFRPMVKEMEALQSGVLQDSGKSLDEKKESARALLGRLTNACKALRRTLDTEIGCLDSLNRGMYAVEVGAGQQPYVSVRSNDGRVRMELMGLRDLAVPIAARVPLSFSVAHGNVSGTEDPKAETVAMLDGFVRDSLGIPRKEAISYEFYRGVELPSAVYAAAKPGDLTIKIPWEALENVGALRRLLLAAHRQRFLLKENICHMFTLSEELWGHLCEVFAILGEIGDARLQKNPSQALNLARTDYADLEMAGAEQQPLKDLLGNLQNRPLVDPAMLETVVGFVLANRRDLYRNLSEAQWQDRVKSLTREALGALEHRDPFCTVLGRVMGIPIDELTGPKVHLVAGLVDESLKSDAIKKAQRDIVEYRLMEPTIAGLPGLLTELLDQARKSLRALSEKPVAGVDEQKRMLDIVLAELRLLYDRLGNLRLVQGLAREDVQGADSREAVALGIVRGLGECVRRLEESYSAWKNQEVSLEGLEQAFSGLDNFNRGLGEQVYVVLTGEDVRRDQGCIPICRRIEKGMASYPSPVGTEIAQGEFDRRGRFFVRGVKWGQEEPAGFLDEKKIEVLRKVADALYHLEAGRRYLELTPRMKFKVVENAYTVIRILKQPDGYYEITVDKNLMELAWEMDLGPILTLALKHKFVHAILQEEPGGLEVDPILEETAGNVMDWLTYWEMKPDDRTKVRATLERLKTKGFMTGPYERFLEDFPLGQDEAGNWSLAKSEGFTNADVRNLFSRAFALSTRRDVNARNYRHLRKIQTRRGKEYLNLRRDILQHEFADVVGRLRAQHKKGRLAMAVLADLVKATDRSMSAYNKYVDGLFRRFSKKITPYVEERIIEENLPRIVRVGTPKVVKRLEDILRNADYTITLRIAVARAILEIEPSAYPLSVSNPLFIKEVLSHAKRLDPSAPGTDGREAMTILELLGNARINDPRLYRDIRSELVRWLLRGQDIMRRHVDNRDKPNARQLFERAKAAADMAERMLDLCQENMEKRLGPQRVPWGLAHTKVEGDPFFATVTPDMTDQQRQQLLEDKRLATLAQKGIGELIRAPEDIWYRNVLRGAIFTAYGDRVGEAESAMVRRRFLRREGDKWVYHVAVTMIPSEKKYDFTFSFIAKPKQEVIDRAKEVSRIGFSEIAQEIHRHCLDNPAVYPPLGGVWESEGHIFWCEKFLPGEPVDPASPKCFLAQKMGEGLEAWGVRIADAIRQYATVCASAWDREGQKETDINIDIDLSKVRISKEDGKMRLVDAVYQRPATGQKSDPPQFLLTILANVHRLCSAYPDLAPILRDMDRTRLVYHGLLDALGEKSGMQLLHNIRDDFQGRKAKLPGDLLDYLSDGWKTYIPPQADVPFTAVEMEQMKRDPTGFQVHYYHRYRLNRLSESPWLWAGLSRRIVRALKPDAKKITPLEMALNQYIADIRENPDLLEPREKINLLRTVEAVIDQTKLSSEQARAFRAATTYEGWAVIALDEKFGKKVGERFHAQRYRFIDIVTTAQRNPAEAAKLLAKEMRGMETRPGRKAQKKKRAMIVQFLQAMGYEPDGDNGLAVKKAYARMLGTGIIDVMDREKLVEMLRRLPAQDFALFMGNYLFWELFWDLLWWDHKKVASTYEREYMEGNKGRITELAYILLWEHKPKEAMSDEEIAYFLDAFASTQTQVAWLNAVVKWMREVLPWQRKWQILDRVANIWDYYYQINPPRAQHLLGAILTKLVGKAKITDVSDFQGDAFLNMLGRIPGKIWLGTLRSMSPVSAGKVLAAYLQMMIDAERIPSMQALWNKLGALEPDKREKVMAEVAKRAGEHKALAVEMRQRMKRLDDRTSHLFTMVDTLSMTRWDTVDRIVAQWLRLPDLPPGVFEIIMTKMPRHAIQYALLQAAKTNPLVFHRILQRGLLLASAKTKRGLGNILADNMANFIKALGQDQRDFWNESLRQSIAALKASGRPEFHAKVQLVRTWLMHPSLPREIGAEILIGMPENILGRFFLTLAQGNLPRFNGIILNCLVYQSKRAQRRLFLHILLKDFPHYQKMFGDNWRAQLRVLEECIASVKTLPGKVRDIPATSPEAQAA